MNRGQGWGAGLEARFRPGLYWGAEFLAESVRLCAFGEKDGKPSLMHTFAGTYAEADAFAVRHGLAYEGLQAGVSHLPFKIEPVEPIPEGGEEDLLPQLERVKPQGLSVDALDAHAFDSGEDRLLMLSREEALRAFLEKQPPSLGALWELTAAPVALLPFLDRARALGHWAALLCEAEYSHLIYFRGTSLIAYAKPFAGWDAAGRDANAFRTEMKKALVYHFGSRFPGLALESIQIWRDGPQGEIAAALKGLGIPQFQPDWGPLATVPEAFRVAGALAWQGSQGLESLASFTVPAPVTAVSRRVWRRRAGKCARAGSLALAGAAIGVALLVLSAFALRWTASAKARTWSGELRRWDAFQQRKAEVDAQLEGMKELLARRTSAYAAMQRIAGLLPPELWLENWEMESGTGRTFTHKLEGYSLAEARVPQFLANLEKSGRLGSVKLKSTERVAGESVEEKTHIQANKKDLIRFQIGAGE